MFESEFIKPKAFNFTPTYGTEEVKIKIPHQSSQANHGALPMVMMMMMLMMNFCVQIIIRRF